MCNQTLCHHFCSQYSIQQKSYKRLSFSVNLEFSSVESPTPLSSHQSGAKHQSIQLIQSI